MTRRFLRLPWRQKLTFLRRLLADKRVPLYAKLFLVGPSVYLAFPLDLIPDFIPVLGYLDDIAIIVATMALVIRLTPPAVLDDLLVVLLGLSIFFRLCPQEVVEEHLQRLAASLDADQRGS